VKSFRRRNSLVERILWTTWDITAFQSEVHGYRNQQRYAPQRSGTDRAHRLQFPAHEYPAGYEDLRRAPAPDPLLAEATPPKTSANPR
jgi:hypothetical protein